MIRISTLLLLCFLPLFGLGQLWQEDRKAERMFQSAIEVFEKREYDNAARYFELLLQREANQRTLSATYMAGLSYYYLNNYDSAIQHFQKLLLNYPGNPYEEDAQLHKSLLMLRKTEKQAGGLFVLMNLIQKSQDDSLKATAEAHLQNFFFYEASLDFLKGYYQIVRPSYLNLVNEAICLQLFRKGDTPQLAKYLDEYTQRNGGKLSARLQRLGGQNAKLQEAQLKIAVVLPFEIVGPNPSLKVQAEWAFDLLAGMRLALENERFPYYTGIDLRVWDSHKSKSVTQQLVDEEIGPWQPNVIIGEIYNSPSRVLADYADQAEALHLIPLSPSESLVQGHQRSYLANPTTSTCIRQLAAYARQSFSPRRVLILKGPGTHSFYVEDFASQFPPGVEVRVLATETHSPEALSGLLADGSWHCLYMPMTDESLVRTYVRQLQQDHISTPILGLPEWSVYNGLNKQLLSSMRTYISDAYAPKHDTIQYNKVRALHESTYRNPPTIYVFQGYDLVRLAAHNLARATPYTKPEEAMRDAPAFEGINQAYAFGQAYSNQRVHILQFRQGELAKVAFVPTRP
ncbi:MAG: tetratricopeptide repeat protein [Sphingobacteriia bacterium]|jgi:tetratricopeptide (TPR) repeat protein